MHRKLRPGSVSATVVFALVTMATIAPVWGASPPLKNTKRFQLWNECRPVRVNAVVSKPAGFQMATPSPKRLASSVRKRLQAAGIHSQDGWSRFVVHVRVGKDMVAVHTKFEKTVVDAETLELGRAVTWDRVYPVRHEGSLDFLLTSDLLPTLTDFFVEQHRRVNASACSR